MADEEVVTKRMVLNAILEGIYMLKGMDEKTAKRHIKHREQFEKLTGMLAPNDF